MSAWTLFSPFERDKGEPMIYDETAAVDHNWVEVVIEGKTLHAKKIGYKAKRNVQNVFRMGKRVVQAFTLGTSEVEDFTYEFDYIAGIEFLSIFGVNDLNATNTDFAGRVFEIVETIGDPRSAAFVRPVGSVANVLKGCEVIGCEWSHEVGEAASLMSFTIRAKELDGAKGAAGGGFKL